MSPWLSLRREPSLTREDCRYTSPHKAPTDIIVRCGERRANCCRRTGTSTTIVIRGASSGLVSRPMKNPASQGRRQKLPCAFSLFPCRRHFFQQPVRAPAATTGCAVSPRDRIPLHVLG